MSRAIVNRINNQFGNVNQGIANANAGDAAGTRASILGSSLNRGSAVSDAYLASDAVNRAENAKVEQQKSINERINIQQDTLEDDINARNRANLDTLKNKLKGAIGENIGDIGKEESYKKIAERLTGYTFKGDYVYKDGKKVATKKEFEKSVDEAKGVSSPSSSTSAKGNKLINGLTSLDFIKQGVAPRVIRK